MWGVATRLPPQADGLAHHRALEGLLIFERLAHGLDYHKEFETAGAFEFVVHKEERVNVVARWHLGE